MPELLSAVAVLGLLSLVIVRVARGRQAPAVSAEARADALRGADEASSTVDALLRLTEGLARAVRATRAHALFVTPPNKTVVRVSLTEEGVHAVEARTPDDVRALVDAWLAADRRPVDLRDGDAHPLRPWLDELGMADAIVLPLTDPEPLGVLVLGNRMDGAPTDEATRRGMATEATAALLDAQRRELLDRLPDSWFEGGAGRRLDRLPDGDVLDRRLAMVSREEADVLLVSMRVHGPEGANVAAVADAVGERLLRTVRRTDLVARIDDDRFGLVLTDLDDHDAALRACARLVERARTPVLDDGVVRRPLVSAGVLQWDGAGTVEDVLATLASLEAAASADPRSAVRARLRRRQHREVAA